MTIDAAIRPVYKYKYENFVIFLIDYFILNPRSCKKLLNEILRQIIVRVVNITDPRN